MANSINTTFAALKAALESPAIQDASQVKIKNVGTGTVSITAGSTQEINNPSNTSFPYPIVERGTDGIVYICVAS